MNRMKLVSRTVAAVGVAAALAMASGVAAAGPLNFSPTFFNSQGGIPYTAAIDPVTGRAWVSPNVAYGDDYGSISTLCPSGACTGALSGLTWASDGQVNAFWKDIGVPLNTVLGIHLNTQSYSAIGANVLGDFINFLGPTDVTGGYVLGTGGISRYLGGLTNNPTVLGVPNTSYMFHDYVKVLGISGLDNESAFTYGAGNGTLQNPPTGGWFYFTPSTGGSTSVPEPGSLGMLGLGLGLLGLGFAWDKRRRNKREQRAGVPMSESFA